MLENRNPLVSVVVITYNSSKYVMETLESVKAQTYENIELIISDDGSTDHTIEMCRVWLAQNNNRFPKTKLLTVEENTGIPANCNRGVRASTGEWVKLIAGDDVFFEDCCRNFVNYIQDKKIFILQTSLNLYKDNFEGHNSIGVWQPSKKINFFALSANKQYELLMYGVYVNAPGVFFKREIFQFITFDEEFRKIEDYPFWVLATKSGFKIFYKDLLSVKYRIHSGSVQQKSTAHMNSEQLKVKEAIKLKYYDSYRSSFPYYRNMLYNFLDRKGFNKDSPLSKLIYSLTFKISLLIIWYKANVTR